VSVTLKVFPAQPKVNPANKAANMCDQTGEQLACSIVLIGKDVHKTQRSKTETLVKISDGSVSVV